MILKPLLLVALAATGASTQASGGRDPASHSAWWWGLAAAANANFYGGTTQQLNGTTITPAPFHEGFGIGPYGALALEYRPSRIWGAMVQAGYDARVGRFDPVACPCGENAKLSAAPAYLSFEPSLRWSPFAGPFYLYAGPRLGLAAPWGQPGRFRYEHDGMADTREDFSNFRSLVFSAQIGAGYELLKLPVGSSSGGNGRVRLSPFIAYQPWLGQNPRSTDPDVEMWRLSTVRIGLTLMWGRAKAAPLPDIGFSTKAPPRVITRNTIYETFPLRNYVFFEDSTTPLAARYVTLTPDEASRFREEQLQDSLPSEPRGRSRRQMVVYHNLLNILGDRLRRNPGATITLTALTTPGQERARARAGAVKQYLVQSFRIAPDRIGIEVKEPPPPPLGRTREDLERLEAEAQRVEIGSRSPEMLVQVGEGFMLKPVSIQGDQEPSDSVIFTVKGSENLSEWSLALRDDQGESPFFGPYDKGNTTEGRMALSGSRLLGERDRARYSATLIGKFDNGPEVRRQASFTLSRRNHGIQETTRFAILFDIDQARAVSSYEKFLSENVADRIPDTVSVIIRGRTDVVGDADYNLTLSKNRAESVRSILENAARRDNRHAVTFKPSWTGEEPAQAPFGNTTPEERSYNRTVIIDIVPE